VSTRTGSFAKLGLSQLTPVFLQQDSTRQLQQEFLAPEPHVLPQRRLDRCGLGPLSREPDGLIYQMLINI
jgi:hypothetical protein